MTNKMFCSWIAKQLLIFRVSKVKFWKIRHRRRYILRLHSTADDKNPFESSQESLSISLEDQQNVPFLDCKTTINIPRQQSEILEDETSSPLHSETSLYGRWYKSFWVLSWVALSLSLSLSLSISLSLSLSMSVEDKQNVLLLDCKTIVNIPRQQRKILEDQTSSALFSQTSLYGR